MGNWSHFTHPPLLLSPSPSPGEYLHASNQLRHQQAQWELCAWWKGWKQKVRFFCPGFILLVIICPIAFNSNTVLTLNPYYSFWKSNFQIYIYIFSGSCQHWPAFCRRDPVTSWSCGWTSMIWSSRLWRLPTLSWVTATTPASPATSCQVTFQPRWKI